MCQFINSNDVFANPDNKDYICYNEAFCTALSGYRYLGYRYLVPMFVMC